MKNFLLDKKLKREMLIDLKAVLSDYKLQYPDITRQEFCLVVVELLRQLTVGGILLESEEVKK